MPYNHNIPVEWESSTPESMYYIDQTMDSIALQPTKTAGLMSRAAKVGLSEPTMIIAGAYSRTTNKANNINNNTLNYSIGKTF